MGGHAAGDLDRGRVFRVAPPGKRYEVPAIDLKTAEGAVAALQSPNSATRYLAWTALQTMGADAEKSLVALWKQSDNPRMRARALWVLGKMPGKGPAYVQEAIRDQDADLRCVGVRLARQLNVDLIPVVASLVADPSAAVLRECAIALRFSNSADAPKHWAALAKRFDGNDRWYLESLGIGAERQ